MSLEATIASYVRDYSAGRLDGETFVVDCLATLRHFAAVHAVDFADADRIARNHYAAEQLCRDCRAIIENAASRDYCADCIAANIDPATITDADMTELADIRSRDMGKGRHV